MHLLKISVHLFWRHTQVVLNSKTDAVYILNCHKINDSGSNYLLEVND